jgi:hypothetical protein
MARSLTWVALFFTLVAGIASAQTQQSVVTADAAGDVASSSPGIEAFNFIDIVEARVAIDNASLVLTWKVNDLSKHPQTIGASAEFWTEFVYSGTTYQAVVEIFGDELQSQGLPGDIFGLAEGRLFRQDEAWTDLATGDAQYVPASSEVVMTIALDAVRTVTELTPGPGEFIRVVQSVGYWDDDNTNSHDKPPAGRVSYRDDAEFAGAELVLPGSTLPGIAISTTHQVRYSNGEATTFQWPVQITNNRDEDVTLDVVASADQGITPKIPSVVQVEAGKSARFNAYATVPFAHEHGGQRTLNLGMSDDAGSTTFKLTIAYVDPPQPAGHHNTLWIHGAQGGSGRLNGAWINTLAEDPTATSDPIPTDVGSCLVNNAEVSGDGWLIPLLPKLTLGIDGNIDQPVTLQAALDVASTLPPGTVHAELLIYDEDKWTEARRAPLVPSDRTGKVAVEQAGPGQVPVELELRLPEIMDLMAPQANANLALRVVYPLERIAVWRRPAPHPGRNARLAAERIPGPHQPGSRRRFHHAVPRGEQDARCARQAGPLDRHCGPRPPSSVGRGVDRH